MYAIRSYYEHELIDTTVGRVILNMHVQSLNGLTVAFGPELWWGANPAILAKYSYNLKGYTLTGIYHEDIDKRTASVSSFAIPTPQTRRATLDIKKKFGPFGFDLGGIWAGSRRIGDVFQIVSYNFV